MKILALLAIILFAVPLTLAQANEAVNKQAPIDQARSKLKTDSTVAASKDNEVIKAQYAQKLAHAKHDQMVKDQMKGLGMDPKFWHWDESKQDFVHNAGVK